MRKAKAEKNKKKPNDVYNIIMTMADNISPRAKVTSIGITFSFFLIQYVSLAYVINRNLSNDG